MRNTLAIESSKKAEEKRQKGTFNALLLLSFSFLLFPCLSGCQELVHMGQISDREGGFAVNNVLIEQQQPGGQWKKLGNTDGNGRWWIIKDTVSGGGKIRLSKPGYHTQLMSESEFLQQMNIVMVPTGGRGVEDEMHSMSQD